MIKTLLQNKIFGISLVILVAAGAYLPYLGNGSLWDRDETNYALVAREMLARGDWSVPYRNGKLFIDKPVFTFWFIAAAFKLFGITEFSARFFSTLFGIANSVLVYLFGSLLFERSVGVYAALIFISSLMVTAVSRAAITDSYLLFFCTASLLFYCYAERTDNWRLILWGYLMMALAVLVKGPVGIFLSAAPVGVYLLISGKLGRLKKMKVFAGGLIVLAVISPWLVSVYQAVGEKFITVFILRHNVGRFLHPMEGHSGRFWYYLPVVVIGFFPWAFFFPKAFISLYRKERDVFAFLISWAATVFLFFSFGATKLPHYMLPLFPPVALILGAYLKDWLAESSDNPLEKKYFIFNLIIAVVSLLITLVVYLIDYRLASFKFVLTLVFLNLMLFWVYRFLDQNRKQAATFGLVAGMVLFYGFVFGYAVPQLEPSRVLVKVARYAGSIATKRDKLYSYDFFEPGLGFYTGRKINKIDSPDELKFLLEQPNRFFMFIRRKDFDIIEGSLRLHKIMEERGINEVKGRMHLLLVSNKE